MNEIARDPGEGSSPPRSRSMSAASVAVSLGAAMTAEYEATITDIQTLHAYARSAGTPIPEATQKKLSLLASRVIRVDGDASADALSEERIALALSVHSELSAAVAPANVRTIRCTDPNQRWRHWLKHLWVVPLVLTMTLLALAALVLIGPSATADSVAAGAASASAAAAAGAGVQPPAVVGLLQRAVQNQLHYLAAAILGAGFYALITAYTYIANRTFDPAYNIVYLVRFFLGVVSGTILANFGPSIGLEGFQTALLGLVGGYSAEAVNQILMRIGETLLAAVKGSGKDDMQAREATLRTEAREQQARQRQRASVELAEVLKVAVDNKAPTDVINRVKVAMDALGR